MKLEWQKARNLPTDGTADPSRRGNRQMLHVRVSRLCRHLDDHYATVTSTTSTDNSSWPAVVAAHGSPLNRSRQPHAMSYYPNTTFERSFLRNVCEPRGKLKTKHTRVSVASRKVNNNKLRPLFTRANPEKSTSGTICFPRKRIMFKPQPPRPGPLTATLCDLPRYTSEHSN